MEFGHCWYMKSVFCKFNYCIHTCTISRYCYCENEQFTKHYFPYLHEFQIKKKKKKNINVYHLSKLKTMGVISQIRKRL